MLNLLAIAAAMLAGAPTLAATGTPVAPTARVQVADLDLGTPAGLNQFDRRLREAVRHVCPAPVHTDLNIVADHRRCVREARRTAAIGRQQVIARAADRQTQMVVAAR